MTEQEIVDQFGQILVGGLALPENDPRLPWINVARIALVEFVGLTKYADENGLLETEQSEEFTPQFEVVEDRD